VKSIAYHITPESQVLHRCQSNRFDTHLSWLLRLFEKLEGELHRKLTIRKPPWALPKLRAKGHDATYYEQSEMNGTVDGVISTSHASLQLREGHLPKYDC